MTAPMSESEARMYTPSGGGPLSALTAKNKRVFVWDADAHQMREIIAEKDLAITKCEDKIAEKDAEIARLKRICAKCGYAFTTDERLAAHPCPPPLDFGGF